MRKLFLTFLIVGYASAVFASPRIPVFLTEEWVRSDYKAAKESNAEPDGGSAIYLLDNGQAMAWCPVAGVPCSATYQEKGGVPRLEDLQVDPDPFTPNIGWYTFDPETKTLRLRQSKSRESTAMLKLEVYKWRRAKVPNFILQGLRQP